jgi:haloalkane dehalogenase
LALAALAVRPRACCVRPQLLIRGEPGYLLNKRLYDIVKSWPNQTEVQVKGGHYVQESSPDEVGLAIANFVRRLRG